MYTHVHTIRIHMYSVQYTNKYGRADTSIIMALYVTSGNTLTPCRMYTYSLEKHQHEKRHIAHSFDTRGKLSEIHTQHRGGYIHSMQ